MLEQVFFPGSFKKNMVLKKFKSQKEIGEYWETLLKNCSKDELKNSIKQYFYDMNQCGKQQELEFFKLTIIGISFSVLKDINEKTNKTHLIFELALKAKEVTTAFETLEWALKMVDTVIATLSEHQNKLSAITRQVVKYIESHFCEDITRQKLASLVYVHTNYLSKLFRKEMGCTIPEYVLRCRINYAKSLLSSTNVKISEISSQVGIMNNCHFSAVFKKKTGFTPKEYRRLFGRVNTK